ncbi:unnamed protein product [Cladocopium goreaui]|uniref:L-2-hydroxyglutarate dehydrogenase, mitochondrial n=1 Tax=Cladocopium goreaui TaxID=2562237 RepID=A0A9P1BUE0_9DINO|nr:unnamed protein product [Cladocopium goreaui]
MLRRFCLEREVPHRICGKLIVATSEAQLPELKALEMKAAGNGVKLEPLSPQQVQQMEPEVYCVEALHSPRTGIVDSHAFMQALLADAEEYGATLALRTQLRGGQVYQEGVMVELESVDSADVFTVEAQAVVNCCGLAAPRVARSLGMEPVPKAFYCRGSYYALQGGLRPFSRLVYPVPEPQTSGLGVHATVDLQGQVRFGPDVEWLPPEILPGLEVDEAAYGSHQAAAYQVDDKKSEAFYSEVRRYWPKLPDGALVADYSGVRPKLSAPGEPAADFQVASYGKLVNLFGIESPGLTSAMSLAEEVVQLVMEGGIIGDANNGKHFEGHDLYAVDNAWPSGRCHALPGHRKLVDSASMDSSSVEELVHRFIKQCIFFYSEFKLQKNHESRARKGTTCERTICYNRDLRHEFNLNDRLCKMKYYNNCLFLSVEKDYIARTGDPTNTGRGGCCVHAKLPGLGHRYFKDEIHPALKHSVRGTVGMANAIGLRKKALFVGPLTMDVVVPSSC